MSQPDRDTALLRLLQRLAGDGYAFTTPTPLTQQRVISRPARRQAQNLADIFGWSLPFAPALAGNELLALMQAAGVLRPDDADGSLGRSTIRVSSLDCLLFAHSAYPTTAADSVFFGPDTYRFLRFVRGELAPLQARGRLQAVDIGCGSGAGAIATALRLPQSAWLLTDINPEALRLAAVNARVAGVAVATQRSDVLAGTPGSHDLIICNPPYLADAQQRSYRHGGGRLGRELSLRIAAQACGRLNPGGRLLLYTGVAITGGVDPLRAELAALFERSALQWRYEEIDPDVFGEELEQPAYAGCDRIAAVGLVVDRAADDPDGLQLDGG